MKATDTASATDRQSAPATDTPSGRPMTMGGLPPSLMRQKIAKRRAQSKAQGAVEEARDDQMEVSGSFDSAASPDGQAAALQQRDRLKATADAVADAFRSALSTWQSVLRARKADKVIEKGLSSGSVKERLVDRFKEMLLDKMREAAGGVLEMAEIPIDPALKVAGAAKGVVDDHVAATQAKTELDAVDRIVAGCERMVSAVRKSAVAKIDAMTPEQVMGTALPPLVNADYVVKQLDLQLMEASRATQTVEEIVDTLHEKRDLGGEIDAAHERRGE